MNRKDSNHRPDHFIQTVFNYDPGLPEFMNILEKVWRKAKFISQPKLREEVIRKWKAGDYPLVLTNKAASELNQARKTLNKPQGN